MRLTDAQVAEAYGRHDIAPLPAGSPEAMELERRLGRHTFFLVDEGVLLFEAAAPGDGAPLRGYLVGTWLDQDRGQLRLHEPVQTELLLPPAEPSGTPPR